MRRNFPWEIASECVPVERGYEMINGFCPVAKSHQGSGRASRVWRGDGAAERAGLENRRPRKGSASSNLAPSAMFRHLTPDS